MITPSPTKTKRKFSRKPSRASHFFYYLSLVAFLGVVVYILFFSSYLLVTSVDVVGARELDKGDVLESVQAEISGSYFNLVAKNNLLLIRKNRIKRLVLEKHKRIEDFEIKKIFPSRLEARIQERNFPLLFKSAGSLWAVDEKGRVFDINIFKSGEIKTDNLIIINDESAKAVIREKELLNAEYISFVLGIREKLKQEIGLDLDNNFSIASLISPDIRVRTQEGWEIYFSREVDLKKEVDMLKVVLDNLIDSQNRQNLQYIDLRIDNKVFYKFKDGTEQEMKKEENEKEPETKPEEAKKKKKKKD